MAEVSGFTAHLYCDDENHFDRVGYQLDSCDGEYIHPSKRGPAIKEAREDGWLIKRNYETICPACNPKSKKYVNLNNNLHNK